MTIHRDRLSTISHLLAASGSTPDRDVAVAYVARARVLAGAMRIEIEQLELLLSAREAALLGRAAPTLPGVE